MRILFLTQIVPYPPNAGPKVKTWQVLRALAKFGHEVTLVSFIRPDIVREFEPLYEICKEVHLVPMQRSRISDIGYWLRSMVTRQPFLIERDNLVEMRTLVSDLIKTRAYDVIHADQLTMTQFAILSNPRRANGGVQGYDWPETVFDAHNAVWTIVNRMAQNAPIFVKPALALEKRRIKYYEGKMVCQFDHTLAVIEPDRAALIQAARDRNECIAPAISVIPIAVDTTELQPVPRTHGSMNIMTLGTLHYPPNADGIRWFLNEVFPLIRNRLQGVSLTIIGKNPPRDFILSAEQQPDAVRVTGFVPDLTPYFQDAAVVVIPVRAGGGMRVRILEAFSRGVPVVTTTIGLEGIRASHERDVMVADQPRDFADLVLRVIEDERLQEKLSINSRKLAVQQYDWQVVLEDLKILYHQPINPVDQKSGS